MKSLTHALCLSASLMAVAAGAPAMAQDTGTAASNAAAFGDIVVIARRREEAAQEVPLAITALSGSTLDQKGVQSVEQLRDVAPGVNIGAQKRDEAQFYIRGQGPGVINAGQRNFSSVATYFAEVPIPVAGPGVFFDLQSVQVLKGPQGTLFGRNTTGGAVLFEPNRPSDNFEGMVRLNGGNYNRRGIEGVVNVPFGNDLGGIRVAGQVERRDGFTRNITSGQKLDGRAFESMRVSVLLRPTDGLENLLIADYSNRDASGSSAVLRNINPNAAVSPNALQGTALDPFFPNIPLVLGQGASRVPISCLSTTGTTPGCPALDPSSPFPYVFTVAGTAAASGGFGFFPDATLNGLLAQQQQLGVRKVAFPGRNYNRAQSFGITNKTTWEITDNLTIKNIIAFRGQRTDEGNDYDGTPLPLIAQFNVHTQDWQFGQDQFTEEFQIQGSLGERLRYIVGFYHEKSKPAFDPAIPSNAFGSLNTRIVTNTDTSDALFAHAEFDLTDTIQVSGGYRHTWDKRKASLAQVNTGTGACVLVNPQTGLLQCPINYSAKFRASTYDGTIQWKPMDGVLVYAAYRRGFKSGGFNLPAPTPELQSFNPETVDDFEVGIKADWDIGIPLRTNLSLFYDKFKDVQVTVPIAIATTGIASVAQNLGKQTNKGFEFETSIVPVEGFTLSGFVSYLDATSDITLPGTPAIKGRQAVYQPKWKYSITGRYAYPLNDGGEIALQADYSRQSKTNSPDYLAPAPFNTFPGYGIFNARLEWNKIGGGNIDAAAFMSNIGNKKYITGGYPLYTQIGFESVVYGEPRMYGASLTYRWGN
ncbi:TonB-dependent receptor [Sphingomonas sp. KC8]|uniref:TonB-dependent receptor n=1 Tax=Sphingomonas sp. KC8 TaxID=1030157 RepID=UPI0002FD8CF3|nr:TonB-dependent receptor [Sphingomonas sp. KC8]ARS25964.1 TonB-dependent receptor [Sphingomonas sp. KC8]